MFNLPFQLQRQRQNVWLAWYCGFVVLCYCGILWYCGILVLWHCGIVVCVQFLPGIVVYCHNIIVVLWYCGIAVLWFVFNTRLVFQSVTIYCFRQLPIQPQLAPLVPAIKLESDCNQTGIRLQSNWNQTAIKLESDCNQTGSSLQAKQTKPG